MKYIILLLSFSIIFQFSFGQSSGDTTVYFIHKFEQNIGKEKCTVVQKGNVVSYAISYDYTDRGALVQLKAAIQTTSTYKPLSFRSKGGTSRFSEINDSIVVTGKTAFMKVDDSSSTQPIPEIAFPVGGYSPATVQMLLIRYWKQQRQPASIRMLPYGMVQVQKNGEDTFMVEGKPRKLERYVIQGLIWGNELLWMDNQDNLVCLITNDAEGDKQEIMQQSYEALLPVMVQKAAMYGMALFKQTAKPVETLQKIAIINGTLLDVVQGIKVPDAVVIVEKGIITKTGKRGEVSVPKDAFVIDAKGKTIVPGLWDMHAHFQQAEWGPAYLAAGVTTVRDCGNEFEYINAIQKAIDDGSGTGPHILKAGVIDGKGEYALGVIQADTKEEAIADVNRYKDNGFVQIKIYGSVKPEIVKVICDEAHKLGLTVTGHIPNGMNLKAGVDSGMDMVNHLPYVVAIMKRDRAKGTIDLKDSMSIASLEFIKSHHVVIDPTIGVFELGYRSLKDSITDIEPAFATLPQPLQVIFKNTGVSSDSDIMRGKAYMQVLKQTLKALYDDSITIVAGTDMDFPGYSLVRELELYVESGLSPMQALQTATITPARVMKADDVSGSLTAGKRADIVIVDADPMENIRNLRKVSLVIKDGIIYKPEDLHKVAGFEDTSKTAHANL